MTQGWLSVCHLRKCFVEGACVKSSALDCGHFPARSALGLTYLLSLGAGFQTIVA